MLKEIHHLRNSGKTVRAIAATLNCRTLLTRRGSAWRLESVARLRSIPPCAPMNLFDSLLRSSSIAALGRDYNVFGSGSRGSNSPRNARG
jgi:hypothetical protein